MTREIVKDLVARGVLRVEDGNHGNDRPRPQEFVSDGVAFIRAADMSSGLIDFSGAGKINGTAVRRIRKGVGAPGDVILSHKGTVGRVAVAPLDAPAYVCSPQTTFWRSLDQSVIDRRFLRYLLLSSDFQKQLAVFAGQTDMAPYVSLTDQRALSIEVPPVARQRAIAEVLGALDDKIAANRREVAAVEALMCALAARTARLTKLGDLAAQSTRSLRPAEFAQRVAHFSLPAFDAEKLPEDAAGDSIKSHKYLVDKPCVLMSKLNPRIPRIWHVGDLPGSQSVASTEFVVLEPRSISSPLLWAVLSSPGVSLKLGGLVAGTSGSHQRVRPAEMLAIEVGDPRQLDGPTTDAIVALGGLTHKRRLESRQLAITRDELLPLLISGRLRVKDAEKAVEGVL